MPVTYHECGQAEYDLLADLIRNHRDDIAEAKPSIALFFAVDADAPGAALVKHGQTILGEAKVNSLRDRAEGKTDATILLDRFCWERMTPIRKRALMHHELRHIGVVDGKTDALGRPKLETIHGDWNNDGFFDNVALYGDDAPEKRYLDLVREKLRQGYLPMDASLGAAYAAGMDVDQLKATTAPAEPKPAPAPAVEPDAPAERWRTVLLSRICPELPNVAFRVLAEECELTTLGEVADFLAGGGRLHDLGSLSLEGASILASAIDRHRTDHDDGSGLVIKAEWLADTLRAANARTKKPAEPIAPPPGPSRSRPAAQAP